MPPQTTLKQSSEIEASPIEEYPESPTMASPCHHIALDLAHNEKSPIQPQNLEIQTFEIKPEEDSEKLRSSTRTIILALVIAVLFIGRFSVPDNEPSCVQDKILNALESANKFINAPGNEHFRNAFQFICSFMVDIVFVITFGYWVVRARSVRLPLSLALFYIVRAGIQSIWMSPFPEGYYWYSPGIPSFVVPYGRGSDFFFSGHSGFLIICACEWNKLGFKKVRNFVLGVTAYTIMILFIYRIHYTIDVFTGVFFAEWCFGKVDLVKEKIENTSAWIMGSTQKALFRKQTIQKEKLAP
jgi:hypothetical protein